MNADNYEPLATETGAGSWRRKVGREGGKEAAERWTWEWKGCAWAEIIEEEDVKEEEEEEDDGEDDDDADDSEWWWWWW